MKLAIPCKKYKKELWSGDIFIIKMSHFYSLYKFKPGFINS